MRDPSIPPHSGKDRPIIFSASMVQALLDGRKTQTRRLMKPPYGTFELVNGEFRPLSTKFIPGDRLWVRENFAIVPATAYRMSDGVQQTVDPNDADMAAIYAAGWERSIPKWRPSIHMPRWASRLTLLVESVKVEHLQDISEADAIAEGIEPFTEFMPPGHHWKRYRDGGCNSYVDCPIGSYASLWTEINGVGSWEANPWICVIGFRAIKANIDSAEARNV